MTSPTTIEGFGPAPRSLVERPIVDTHAHVFHRRMPLSKTAWNRPDYDFPVEALAHELDGAGIPFCVIAAASLFDDLNDVTLEALAAHRRFRATAIVRPDIDRISLKSLAESGIVGIRLVWAYLDELPDLTAPEYRRLLFRAASLNLHVQLFLDGPRLERVLPALTAAGVDVVIDHFGYPSQGADDPWRDAVTRAVDSGRTWIKLSAGYRLESREVAARCAADLMRIAGPDRLLWGSDAPFVGREGSVTYRDALTSYFDLVPDPADRRTMSEAALRLYYFR